MAAPHQFSVVSGQLSEPVAAAKAAMRREALVRRAAVDPASSGNVCARIVAMELPSGAVIAGVWPLAGEIDLRPALAALHARGHPIALPETPPRGRPLIFRRWTPGTAMIRERFGTARPDAPETVPDILLVPLLAFDATLHRLGYGGGYYDATLAALPGRRALGFAYAAQLVDKLPREPHDRPLDAVITEHGVVLPA